MKKTYKTILMSGVAAFSVVALASCGDKDSAASGSGATPAAPDTAPAGVSAESETVSLELSGLKWASGCPPKVRSALSKLDGVTVKDVTKTSAEVTVDRSKVSDDDIVKAVMSADPGYSATIK